MFTRKIRRAFFGYLCLMLAGSIFGGQLFFTSFIGLVPLLVLLAQIKTSPKSVYIWFSLSFSLGSFIVWGPASFIMNVSWERIFIYHYDETWPFRGVLAFWHLCGISLGTFFVLMSIKEDRQIKSLSIKNSVPPQLALYLFFAVFLLTTFYYIQVGVLWDRSILGSRTSKDTATLRYLVGGIYIASYYFFVLLGMRAKKNDSFLLSLGKGAFVIILILPLFASGGRSGAIEACLYFLGGLSLSNAGPRRAYNYAKMFTPILLLAYIMIGFVRGQFDYSQSLDERFNLFSTAVTEMEITGQGKDVEMYGGPWSRLVEIEAHRVIDHLYHTQDWVGFEDFSLFFSNIFPRFINPSRSFENYGSKLLYLEYDVTYDENTASPLTTIASSYRRWGKPGVFLTGLFIGVILTFWNILILRIRPLWVRNLVFISLIVFLFRQYTVEVVSLGNLLFYQISRNVILTLVIAYVAMALLTARKNNR